jgi:hypothetical protein
MIIFKCKWGISGSLLAILAGSKADSAFGSKGFLKLIFHFSEGELDKTLMSSWNKKALYYGMINQRDLGMEGSTTDSHVKKTMTTKQINTTLDSRVHKQWKVQMENMGIYGNTVEGEIKNVVITVKSVQIFN